MHSLRTFFFHGKVMFRSWDTQLFIFLTITSTWKVLTSKWVLVYNAEPIFDFFFVMLNFLAMKLETWWTIFVGGILHDLGD